MKYLAHVLLILGLLLVAAPSYAEQVNYTSMIKTWAQKLHPGNTVTFSVKEVVDLGVESGGPANGELGMWVVLTADNKEEHHILIIKDNKVFATKKFDPNKPESNEGSEGPSCSPEEHEQHHGKKDA